MKKLEKISGMMHENRRQLSELLEEQEKAQATLNYLKKEISLRERHHSRLVAAYWEVTRREARNEATVGNPGSS